MLCAVNIRLSMEDMVNTVLLSIVAPAGGSSAPTGFLKLLTDTTV